MWDTTPESGLSNGKYCDGLSPAYRPVRISRLGEELAFAGPGLTQIRLNPWNLRAVGPFKLGRPFSLALSFNPKARIVIEDDELSRWLVSANPRLIEK